MPNLAAMYSREEPQSGGVMDRCGQPEVEEGWVGPSIKEDGDGRVLLSQHCTVQGSVAILVLGGGGVGEADE